MPIDGESQSELKSILRTLSAEQIRFVAARMYANSDAEAARNAGVSPASIYRWPNRSIVEEAIRLASGNVIPLAVEALQRHVMPAVETLGAAVVDTEAHWRDRIVAASSVLDRTGIPKTKEIHGTMETRVTYRLEDILAAQAMASEVETLMVAHPSGGPWVDDEGNTATADELVTLADGDLVDLGDEDELVMLDGDLAFADDADLTAIGDDDDDWAWPVDEELPFSEPPESEE